jgi:hypothetical protein
VTGVHHDAGPTTGDGEDAVLKRALAARGRDLGSRQRGEDRRGVAVRRAGVARRRVVTDAPAEHPEVRRLVERGFTVVHA